MYKRVKGNSPPPLNVPTNSIFNTYLINTNGLAEVLVLPQGPLRAKAGVWALEQWSDPDYQALRDADTGMAITGWVR